MSEFFKKRQFVLDFPVDICDQEQALALIKEYWQSNKDLHVITLNAEMIMTAEKDSRLAHIINQSNLVIPDGAGVVLALKLQGFQTSRLPGIELAMGALKLPAQNNIAVALLGASAEVLTYLRQTLPEQIANLNLVFCQDGYFDLQQQDKVISDLTSSGAQLVLVAMGVPRQEFFIEQALKASKHKVFIGVGGSFDVWAGKVERAPKIWQDSHLEWLYRLVKEPWRYKRMCSTLPVFAYQVIFDFLKKLLLNKANP